MLIIENDLNFNGVNDDMCFNFNLFRKVANYDNSISYQGLEGKRLRIKSGNILSDVLGSYSLLCKKFIYPNLFIKNIKFKSFKKN